jgi:hypothetical protein
MLNAVTSEFYKTMAPLFEQMYTFHFYNRLDDTKEILHQYDQLLQMVNKNININANAKNDNTLIRLFDERKRQPSTSSDVATQLDQYAYEDAPSNSYNTMKSSHRQTKRQKRGGKSNKSNKSNKSKNRNKRKNKSKSKK